MNRICHLTAVAGICACLVSQRAHSQSAFQNLDFESANVSAYAGGSTSVPMGLALPGWSVYYTATGFQSPVSTVWYDEISAGGAAISVVDTHNLPGYQQLQGQFSVLMFGGGSGDNVTANLSQTGLVPANAQSLLIDVKLAISLSYDPFMISLGNQQINMVPLQAFAGYTRYGGDISSLAGQTETLTISEPPPASTPPSALEVDDIVFSSTPVPEPFSLILIGCGLGAVMLSRKRNEK